MPPPPTTTDGAACITVRVDVHPGFPCRRCLRDGEVGQEMILTSYNPFTGVSPYAGPSPIYLHRDCVLAQPEADELPPQQRSRLLSLRAYDARHRLVDAEVAPGEDATPVIRRMLGETGVEYLHLHNAGPGCFAVRVDRAGDDGWPNGGS